MKNIVILFLLQLPLWVSFAQKAPDSSPVNPKGPLVPQSTDIYALSLPAASLPTSFKASVSKAIPLLNSMAFIQENINVANETIAQATPLGGISVKLRGNLFPASDFDFYSFQAIAGDRVYVALMTAFSAGFETDSRLRLLASNGTTTIEFDDDNGSFGDNSSSIAGAIIPTTGTYYLQISDGATAETELPYDLYLHVQRGNPTPEVESNDTPATANDLPGGGWVSGTIDPASATEIDWYAITLAAGESVFISLDLNPERDATVWDGRLRFGLFGNADDQVLVADDPGTIADAQNPSEALFFTVKTAGTYYIGVDPSNAATGGPTATYQLSVSKLNALTGYVAYTSTDAPQSIGPNPGSISSTITIPDTKLIKNLAVRVTLDHGFMQDLDAILTTPQGERISLFSDIGSTGGQTQMDIRFDDYNSLPPFSAFTKNIALTPKASSKLDQLRGVKTNGTWTLTLFDDALSDGGTLTSWSLEVLEDTTPNSLGTVLYQEDFEAGNGGFTHSGNNDQWARGLPNTPATTTLNPVASFTTANSGVNCWKTNLTGPYTTNSNQVLESPNISLAGVVSNSVILSWAMKHQMESTNFDQLSVHVEEVGNSNNRQIVYTWLGADQKEAAGSPFVHVPMTSGWGTHFADISAFKGKVIRFKVRLQSDATVGFGGVAIDDVQIYNDCFTVSNPVLSVTSAAVCAGQSVTTSVSVSGTALSYQWYKNGAPLMGNPSAISATLVIPASVTTDSGSYSVVVTNACNSVTSTAFSLTVNPTPTLSLSNNGPLTCARPSVRLVASLSGQGNYVFSPPATSVAPPTSATATTLQTGSYSVTLTQANGCTNTASTTVQSNTALSDASFTGLSSSYCNNAGSVSLTPAITGGTFSGPGVSGSTFSPASAGSGGTIAYSITAANGCVSSTTQTVTVSPFVPVNLSNDGPLTCLRPVVSLLATPSGQGTYVFSASATQVGRSNSATATIAGPGLYSVTLISAGGCTATASTSVQAIQMPPTPTFFTTSTPDGLAVQVLGGVQYERLKLIDRVNGYEIRQTEINLTGYFLITQPGPFAITVIAADGCRAILQLIH